MGSSSWLFSPNLRTIKPGYGVYNKPEMNGLLSLKANVIDVYTKTESDSLVNTAVNNLVNSAPGALDTLKELADAINDDANFASTTITNIATVTTALNTHESNTSNPHSVTKAQVGLGNVTNESKTTMFTDPSITGRITFSTGNGGMLTKTNSYNTWETGLYNNYWFWNTTSSGDRMILYNDGSLVATGNVTAYSDEKLKENIETIDNALEKTLSLRGVYYNKKEDETKTRKLGVIAQEVNKVIPEVILEGHDGTLSVDYGNIVGLLIEAIKEQQIQIDNLTKMLGK